MKPRGDFLVGAKKRVWGGYSRNTLGETQIGVDHKIGDILPYLQGNDSQLRFQSAKAMPGPIEAGATTARNRHLIKSTTSHTSRTTRTSDMLVGPNYSS